MFTFPIKADPSDRFKDIANIAGKHGTRMSAEIQTGNSHEVVRVPLNPAPSLLYKKFTAVTPFGSWGTAYTLAAKTRNF